MGCKECNRELDQKKIEILFDKRQDSKCSNDKPKLDLEKEVKELRDIYYNNLDDESALVNYLEALKNNKHMKEFENELIIYFDVLSAMNRFKFTDVEGFIPSINIFRNVIELICDFEFEAIKRKEYYIRSYDICGRRKFIISQTFSDASLKSFFSNEEKESLKKERSGIQIIEKKRRFQKISLLNPELFFNELLQLYFKIIEKADENHINTMNKITRQLFDLILKYLKLIENNQNFSKTEIKMMNILLYAPIIGNNNSSIRRLIYNFENNDNNKYNDCKSDIIYSGDKLIINDSYKRKTDNKIQNEKKCFNNAHIYNIKLIKNEIIDKCEKENLTEISLMKYVKIEYFQNYNFYTYNQKYWNFNKTIFRYILQSKTIKTLFQSLYPNGFFIFENEENINQLIDSIVFVPFELYETYGYTAKRELLIFIEGLFEHFSKPMHYLSKSSAFIILGLHEGCGHWSSSFYSILYQDRSLFDSLIFTKEIKKEIMLINEKNPNNTENISINDVGDMIELLLFGRKIDNFSIKEIFFLLSKNSYDVDYKTFRKNFKEVSNVNFDTLYDKVSMNPELSDIMETFKMNKEYFQTLKKRNKINYIFKRNGETLITSKCGELRL